MRTQTDFARIARVFHALSDETRVQVLDMLASGEKCVCDLQEALGAAQSRLSFHLRVLRDAGLLNDRRQGRWNFYSIAPEAVEEIVAFLQERTPEEDAWGTCGCGTPSHDGRCCE